MANTDLDGGRSDVDGVSLTASRSLLALVIVSLGTSRDDGGDGNGDSALNPDDVLAALRKIGPYAATCKPEHISGVIDALSDAMGSAGAARNTCLSYPRVLSLHPGTLRSRLTVLESALDDRLGGNSVDERRRLLSESSSTVGRLLRESFDVTNARAFADKLCEDV